MPIVSISIRCIWGWSLMAMEMLGRLVRHSAVATAWDTVSLLRIVLRLEWT